MKMTDRIKTIAFDADDTLWHNEPLFSITQGRFRQFLTPYHTEEWIDRQLYETQMRNLQHFGYGVKAFTLSMIETAIELTEGRISGGEIQQIIAFAKEMVAAPVRLLQGAAEAIIKLSGSYELMLITKGDLFDQESKIARSGLGDYFKHIEVVSDKTVATYEAILRKHDLAPSSFLMTGNSIKSDILPVIALGARAVYIPYDTTWVHERTDDYDAERDGFIEIANIALLPSLLERLDS